MSQSKIQLKATRADSISFTNNMQGSGQLKLGFKYSYNLRHAAPGVARGEVTITAEDKEAPEKLSITVKQSGIFALPTDINREEAHLETFKILFPYTSATLTEETPVNMYMRLMQPLICLYLLFAIFIFPFLFVIFYKCLLCAVDRFNNGFINFGKPSKLRCSCAEGRTCGGHVRIKRARR